MKPQEEHNEAEKGKRNMEKLFDLQVFAQENTQTTGGLSAEMKTYYGMELLDNAKPQLVHNQFAATKPLPTGGGKTVEWRKFGSFDKALTPLTEGVTPDGSGISVSYITKELAQYGDYTTVSDMLDLTAIDDVVLEITDRHGANMGLTLDTVTRNEIQQGKQVLYAPAIGADGSKTEVTARGALTAACRLTSEMVAKAATQLKKMNAPTFDGKYVCILHPSVAFDLRQDEAWIAAHQYAAATELFSGEIGELHGVRFVETTEAKIFRGGDLAQNGRTLLVNGKVENNAVVAFDGGTVAAGALAGRYVLLGGERRRVVSNTGSSMTLDSAVTAADNAVIYPGEGGAEGCAVYGCLFVGKGAYGVVDLNDGTEVIVNPVAPPALPTRWISAPAWAGRAFTPLRSCTTSTSCEWSAAPPTPGRTRPTKEKRKTEGAGGIARTRRTERSRQMQEKMKTVLIPKGRKNEENFVLVSVNGRNFKIMKGVEVQVPEFVAQVLENARMMEDDARSYVDRMAN